jgi:hypothetical protein
MLDLPKNNYLGANTIAYSAVASLKKKKKRFIKLTPGANVEKRLLSVIYESSE